MTTTTEATEHPIIFNDWSIKRILAGEKTQTRRLTGLDEVNDSPFEWESGEMMSFDMVDSKAEFGRVDKYGMTTYVEVDCPYGKPGDVLWVREAFRFDEAFDDYSPLSLVRHAPPDRRLSSEDVQYEATPEDSPFTEETQGRLRPSIHMPEELCRLRLHVEDVRVERLTDISAAGVEAEGIDLPEEARGYSYLATQHFEDVWNDTHGDGAWERDPWVWVVGFSRIE